MNLQEQKKNLFNMTKELKQVNQSFFIPAIIKEKKLKNKEVERLSIKSDFGEWSLNSIIVQVTRISVPVAVRTQDGIFLIVVVVPSSVPAYVLYFVAEK